MRILVFGDIATWNLRGFELTRLDNEVLKKIVVTNYVVCNLEGPIYSNRHFNTHNSLEVRSNYLVNYLYKALLKVTNNIQPIVCSDMSILDLLKLNKNTIVTLANNHIKDLGKTGFINTLKTLNDNKIKYVGAGMNLSEANNILKISDEIAIINVNYVAAKKHGLKLLIYNATAKNYGAGYLEIHDLKRKISLLHSEGFKVLLILHTGKGLPSTNKSVNIDFDLIKSAKADITVMHHPHIYLDSGYEKENLFILGDFVLNRPNKLDHSRSSAYLEIKLHGSKIHTVIHKFKIGEIYEFC